MKVEVFEAAVLMKMEVEIFERRLLLCAVTAELSPQLFPAPRLGQVAGVGNSSVNLHNHLSGSKMKVPLLCFLLLSLLPVSTHLRAGASDNPFTRRAPAFLLSRASPLNAVDAAAFAKLAAKGSLADHLPAALLPGPRPEPRGAPDRLQELLRRRERPRQW
ncbi:hypothetical protein NL676_037003 [Syzygium grande]|nr:hypothetical protein NL676_037003 [Syzygium grande]